MSLILSGSNGVSDIDGDASTPAIRGTDTNTGIFFPAADTIGFAEGGAEAMRIDSSGNVGIGNATARGRLTVSDGAVNTAGEAVYQAYIVGTSRTPTSDLTAMLTIQSTNALAADVGGSIAFGGRAVSASTAGANWATIAGFKENATTSEFGGYLQFVTRPNSGAAAERARITSDGKFFVNETAQLAGYSEQAVITANSTQVALALKSSSASIALATTTTDTNTYNAAVFANNGNFSGALKGTISVSNTATAYNTTSDYRLKENVQPMQNALATVTQLKPCTYTWKADGSAGQGFIAHELQAVVPDAVTGEKDGVELQQYEISPAIPATYDEERNELTPAVEAVMGEREVPKYQGVDTSFLIATLTAAIQELKAELDTVKAQNAAFEARLAALENK